MAEPMVASAHYLRMFRDELAEPKVRFAELNAFKNEVRLCRQLISEFASAEIDHQVRRAIHRLQRIKAAGVFEEWPTRTFWDEMCVEQFVGPGEFRPYMEPDVGRVLEEIVANIPDRTALILIYWLTDEMTDGEDGEPYMDKSLLVNAVDQELWHQALMRGERMNESRMI